MTAGRGTALFTDLYELTMAASYHELGLDRDATFDLSVRRLPERRNFLVAAGLGPALEYLEGWKFDAEDLAYIASLGSFRDDFLARLGDTRFTGEVRAIPEGTAVFPNEPLLEVTAPLIEAQLVETALLNVVGFQTMVASKAARVALACGSTRFVDFSARRDHGFDAALGAARASFIGGASATSLVEAGRRFGLPLSGTMAHSYVMSFTDEREAFLTFARGHRDDAVLLIDTYDTLEGARRAASVAREVAAEGIAVRAVRLDSGDLGELAVGVRAILDEAGLEAVSIFASGDLDEDRIADLRAAGAPIDAWGVGTRLGTSRDAPALDIVYKLVEDEQGSRIKLASGKLTPPGRKQVHRVTDGDTYERDVLALEHEEVAEGVPLLETVMAGGRRTTPPRELEGLQEACREETERLPTRLRSLDPADEDYEVCWSPGLTDLIESLRGAGG